MIPLRTYLRSVALAKGATTSYTVGTGRRAWIANIAMGYTADATVATRIITVYIDQGTPELTLVKFDVTASQALKWQYPVTNPAYAAYLVLGVNSGYPLLMSPAMVLNFGISNAQAGDTWSGTALILESVFPKA
jgi:hypothetical protein